MFNWITRSDPFSVSTFALNRLLAQIDHQLEIYCSNTGRSYFWDVITKTPGRLTRTVTLRLDVDRGIMNNTSLIKHRLWPEIKERVLAPVFQPETIRTIMNREKKRLEVNPVRVGTYNEWMLSGLVEWGRMVDYDRVLRGYLNIAPGDFNLWEEQFLTEEPVILVVGDLS